MAVLAAGSFVVAGMIRGEGHSSKLAPPPHFVTARAVAVLSGINGATLYDYRGNTRLAPGSLAKVMTALVVLERVGKLDLHAVVPKEALARGGRQIGLAAGDRITIGNLLRCTMITGASDCAFTLANYVSGDEKRFVALMNARAKGLGMTNTYFESETGAGSSGSYSSALDLGNLGRVIMQSTRFRAFVDTPVAMVSWPPSHVVILRSYGWLTHTYSWASGVGSRDIFGSGLCSIVFGVYKGHPLIVVTLDDKTTADQKADVMALFRYGARLARRR